jgi:hypothetical protein
MTSAHTQPAQLDLFGGTAGRCPLAAHVWRKESNGFYVEPEWCSERLFAVEEFTGAIWDPACGFGRVPEAARRAGYNTRATEIVDRGYEHFQGGADFLLCDRPHAENIVCNPPFEICDAFVKLNDNAPKCEWREGPDGKPRGPYQTASIVRLLNPETWIATPGARPYSGSAPTSTIGACLAVRDLVDRTLWMRKFRGANVFPLVTPSNTFMHTRFGGRQRAHFKIEGWVTFGLDGPDSQTAVLRAPDTPLPPATQQATPAPSVSNNNDNVQPPKAAPRTRSPTPPTQPPQSGMRTVEPPSAAEAVDDEIPF